MCVLVRDLYHFGKILLLELLLAALSFSCFTPCGLSLLLVRFGAKKSFSDYGQVVEDDAVVRLRSALAFFTLSRFVATSILIPSCSCCIFTISSCSSSSFCSDAISFAALRSLLLVVTALEGTCTFCGFRIVSTSWSVVYVSGALPLVLLLLTRRFGMVWLSIQKDPAQRTKICSN